MTTIGGRLGTLSTGSRSYLVDDESEIISGVLRVQNYQFCSILGSRLHSLLFQPHISILQQCTNVNRCTIKYYLTRHNIAVLMGL